MDSKRVVWVSVAIASVCTLLALVLFSILADVVLMEVTNSEEVFLLELNELGWQPVRWSLLVDLFFPILYVLLCLLAVRFAYQRVYSDERARKAGPWIEIVAVVAGVADLLENTFLLIAIGGGPNPPESVAPAPLYLSSLFSYIKWLGLVIVIAYSAPALVIAVRRHRRARRAEANVLEG